MIAEMSPLPTRTDPIIHFCLHTLLLGFLFRCPDLRGAWVRLCAINSVATHVCASVLIVLSTEIVPIGDDPSVPNEFVVLAPHWCVVHSAPAADMLSPMMIIFFVPSVPGATILVHWLDLRDAFIILDASSPRFVAHVIAQVRETPVQIGFPRDGASYHHSGVVNRVC